LFILHLSDRLRVYIASELPGLALVQVMIEDLLDHDRFIQGAGESGGYGQQIDDLLQLLGRRPQVQREDGGWDRSTAIPSGAGDPADVIGPGARTYRLAYDAVSTGVMASPRASSAANRPV
jgi:hypothetical protein